MNEGLWTTGTVYDRSGKIAWPGMMLDDTKHLPVAPLANPSQAHIRVNDVSIDEAQFTADIIFMNGKPPARVVLRIDAEYARSKWENDFPVAEELAYYENLFERHFGTRSHEQKLTWGIARIADDPWTRDPSIGILYSY